MPAAEDDGRSLLLDEAREHFRMLHRVIEETDRRALEVLKFDGLLMAILAALSGSLVASGVDLSPILMPCALVGVVTLLASSVASVLTLARTTERSGMSGFEEVEGGPYSRDEIRILLLATYDEMIAANATSAREKLERVAWANRSLLLSLVTLGLTACVLIAGASL